MKRFHISLFYFTCLFTTMISCKDSVTSDLEVTEKEHPFQSEVSRLEEQSGTKYFKKNLFIHDGNNEVVLQVASSDESVLNDYLRSQDLTIKPVLHSVGKLPTKSESLTSQANQSSVEQNETSVIIEVLSLKLQKEAVGYLINFKERADSRLIRSKNARPALYSQHYEVISPTWPEIFTIKAWDKPLQFGWDRQDRWYSNWYKGDNGYQWLEPYMDVFRRVDGPYKVKVHIWCDPSAPGQSTWSVGFVNHI